MTEYEPLCPLTGWTLTITLEGNYMRAYASPPDGAAILSYGLEGRVDDFVCNGVKGLVEKYLEAQRA